MDKKQIMINKLWEFRNIWEQISELCDEIDDEDKDYCMGEFAENYPFTKSFDEYPSEIEAWIESLQEAYGKEKKNKINIEWANASYTGGGLYAYIGKFKNGNYFMAADDWNDKDESFVYEVDSEVVFDEFEEGNPDPWTLEWMDEHLVKTHSTKAFKQILKWIITNEPDGNYDVGELDRRLRRI